MKQHSLKNTILTLLIIFILVVTTTIGIISILNLYFNKIETSTHNQTQVLKQVKFESLKLLKKVEDLSTYIKRKYNDDNKILESIIEINSDISSIIILNKNGKIIDFNSKVNLNIYKGFDYSKKEYFKKIDEKNQKYWSEVFLSTIDEQASISFSFKLEDKVGVIILKLNELSKFMTRFISNDLSHMVRIFDRNGILILNPDAPYLVAQRFDAIDSDIYTQLIDSAKTFENRIFQSFSSDNRDYGMYTNVELANWKIVVRDNYDFMLSKIFSLILEIIMVVTLISLFSIFMAFNISNRVFKSLYNLKETTSSMANGNYDIKISDSYYEEFNSLINSLDKMRYEIIKREHELEKSLNSFKSLVNSTMEAIVIHEREKCIYANDVAVELLGYGDVEELINKNFLDFIADESKDEVRSNLAKNTEPYEFGVIKKDGSKISALGQSKFLEYNNEIIKISTLVNITEIKDKDKMIFQQNKMAAMGEMIGNIAHQWRQPLNAISTSASGMKIQREFGVLNDEEFFKSIKNIVNSTKYLSKTIDDFRNFFKSDKEYEKFSVKQAINKNLALLQSSLKVNNISVYDNIDNDLEIYGLRNELTQALINIFNNAKDAFKIREVTNRYIFIKSFKHKDHIYIEIKDNAGGIPKGVISKIFEPYFTTKHKSQGTGIGLYMTHQIIVDHMNGFIKVENEEFEYEGKEYKGAKFTLKFPIV